MSSHLPSNAEEIAYFAEDRPLRQSQRIERKSYVEDDALDGEPLLNLRLFTSVYVCT